MQHFVPVSDETLQRARTQQRTGEFDYPFSVRDCLGAAVVCTNTDPSNIGSFVRVKEAYSYSDAEIDKWFPLCNDDGVEPSPVREPSNLDDALTKESPARSMPRILMAIILPYKEGMAPLHGRLYPASKAP